MKKRFIAGVVCPKCGAADAMRAGENEDGTVLERECVDCGFTDKLSTGLNVPNELTTRVNDPLKPSTEHEPVQIVKFIE
ncbi:YheV family putative zinc ribbon protein [Reinekea marina]|uniref:YheV family putative zinc ribbon protein n=1 Tax=Reinekea marina TaxID=1310421 RepID=A0ABV7WQ82_9GAMM|nr:YheV family putative zinc ribbon protein [Reinekea marina]MBU2864506.1 YheV family putative metal-binding protein [Reinekea forsetii]MDN3647688.1 YheV family putative zinc ribbon protein [Reinekea marina]